MFEQLLTIFGKTPLSLGVKALLFDVTQFFGWQKKHQQTSW